MGALAAIVCLAPAVQPSGIGAFATLGFFAIFQIVLMGLAVPVTAFGASARGYLSFDRLPLVAAILLFGPMPAAWIAAAAAFAWTLAADQRREQWPQRFLRALANGGMFLLATLAAGFVYRALGGKVPIAGLNLIDLGAVCMLILTLQAVNEALYIVLSWPGMDRTARRKPVHWPSTLIELGIAWTGVITALAYVKMPLSGFALYIGLIVSAAMLLKLAVNVAERERQRAVELAAVNRVNQAVSATANLDELLEIIFRECRGLMNFAALIIGLYLRETDEIDIRLNYDDGVRRPPTRRKPGAGVLAWVIENQESVFIADARTSDHPSILQRIVTGRPAVALMATPINFHGELVGVISVQDYHARAFQPRHLQLLEGFAHQIAAAIVNTRLFSELQAHQQELEVRVANRTAALARTTASLETTMQQKELLLERLEQENRRDPLTGLANRRHLDETLRQEHYRAQRFRHPLAVAMGDLDEFKRINDNWGHALGDEVLKAIAEILRTGLRVTDLTARYGGEEFVILFPETTLEAARGVCEKLRGHIEHHPWERIAPNLAVTMSFGVAEIAPESASELQLLAAADRALYRAKREGRNCVCTDTS